MCNSPNHQEEAAEHQPPRCPTEHRTKRQGAGLQNNIKQQVVAWLASHAIMHALAKTEGDRQTACLAPPFFEPDHSNTAAAHGRRHGILFCEAETEGVLPAPSSLSTLTTPLPFLSSHTGKPTACFACVKRQRSFANPWRPARERTEPRQGKERQMEGGTER